MAVKQLLWAPPAHPESWKVCTCGHLSEGSIWDFQIPGPSGLRKGLPASERCWLSHALTLFRPRDHVLRGPGQLDAQTVLRWACR